MGLGNKHSGSWGTVVHKTVGKLGDSVTGNSRGRNDKTYDAMVDVDNRNQQREGSGNRGRERKITRFPVPVPTTFSRLDLYRAYPCFFCSSRERTHSSLSAQLKYMDAAIYILRSTCKYQLVLLIRDRCVFIALNIY